MHRAAVLALVLAAALTAATPAAAHMGAAAGAVAITPAVLNETLSAAPALPSVPWTVLAMIAGFALAVAIRPRRAIALTLALVVTVLAFEIGVHSTHHLGRADDAARCLVAWMSTQLHADVVDVVLDASIAALPTTATPWLASPIAGARAIAPDAGRAPPAFSA